MSRSPSKLHRVPRYEVVDGRVQSEKCELNIVEHCNLSCRACSHLSPVMPRYVADPSDIERDLTTLARSYRVRWVRLLGGEPLLHPDLPGVIAAARRSGIGERIAIVTNGVLLARVPRSLWREVDGIELCLYPGHELPADVVAGFRRLASAEAVDLRVLPIDVFRESYSELGTDDDSLVRTIYRRCELAHVWRCHTVAHGTFFKCPPAYFLPRQLRGLAPGDGIEIDGSPGFAARLLAYLESPAPLVSCRNCLGSVGKTIPHTQVKRSAFRGLQERRTEELVDDALLQARPPSPAARVRRRATRLSTRGRTRDRRL